LWSRLRTISICVVGAVDIVEVRSTYLASLGDFIVNPTKRVYLDGGSDTYIYELSANRISLVAGAVVSLSVTGTDVFTGTGVNFSVSSTQKVFLDGGSDTYIYEASSNVMSFVAGTVESLQLGPSYAYSPNDFVIGATKKLRIDGSTTGDTYIYEAAANDMQVYAGGSLRFEVATTAVVSYQDFIILSTKKFYLDGGGDTYIFESSANVMDFFAGGSRGFVITPASVQVPATRQLYLDGGGDTYLYESSANTMDFYSGATRTMAHTPTRNNFFLDTTFAATKLIYIDGGGDTYITESSANVMDHYVGGTRTLVIQSTSAGMANSSGSLYVQPTGRIYLDGVGDTYLAESSANVLDLVAGGTTSARFTSTTAVFVGTISTADPGTGAGAWKFGIAEVHAMAIAGPNVGLRVKVDGIDRWIPYSN
jgi:hypothetical protein